MKRKILALFSLAACFSSAAYAGKIYVGPSLFLQQLSANQSNFRGLHPKMSVGYANMLGNIYLAGEVFLDPFTLSLSDKRNPGATSTKTSKSFGASFIPGTRICQGVLGYGRLGLVSSKFSSPDSSKLGTQLGLGIQTGLTANWVLRGDYIYTIYGSVDRIGTPNSNEIGVGLLYYFDH